LPSVTDGKRDMLKRLLIVGATMVTSLSGNAPAADKQGPCVRVAELEVEPTQLENFKAAAKEVDESSVRADPGCLVLYAVSEKDNPSHIRVFEIYRDADPYKTSTWFRFHSPLRRSDDRWVRLITPVPRGRH